MKKQILVAAAWPYANGSLHLGHVAGLIGADIIARYHRLHGDDVLFVSGSDCHGTPIAVEAEQQGVHPSVIADKYHKEFVETLISGLNFSYDIYTKTTTETHQKVVQDIFLKLYRENYIYTKTEELPYCQNCQRFLPDRYVEGECSICHFQGARGDQCDECGNLLDPRQLVNPRCKICFQSPEWCPTEHFFFKLSAFQDKLKKWVEKSQSWRINAKNFTVKFLEQGLHDRAITRDTQWGIPIPLSGYESKRIYVWFEAVCGYLSASIEWSQVHGTKDLWQKFWVNDSAIHYYVHGKDNILFHTIVWPAILIGNGELHLPDKIISSEYLTLEKKQFSKSRHWAVLVPDFLVKFDPDTLRYYLVVSGPESADADFSWSEYLLRTNSELIATFGNFVHRTLSLVKSNFPSGVKFPERLDRRDEEFISLTKKSFITVGEAIEAGRFREGLRTIFSLTEEGNRYINDAAPWNTVKSDLARAERNLAVATQAIQSLAVLLNPYLPRSSEKICNILGVDIHDLQWEYRISSQFNVGDLKPIYRKLEKTDIEKEHSHLGKE